MSVVPEAPELKLRRRLIWGGTAAFIVAAVVIAVGASMAIIHAGSVNRAFTVATDHGRAEEIDDALDQLSGDTDDSSLAMRACLRAMGALELERPDDAKRAAELLAQFEGKQSQPALALAATAYLALYRGELDKAVEAASLIEPKGDWVSELARARAVVSLSVGDLERAKAGAVVAAQTRTSGARHVTLLALIDDRIGARDAALTLLSGFPGAEESPAVRIAQARILMRALTDLNAVETHIKAVQGELAEVATPAELSWARLLDVLVRTYRGEELEALDALAKLDPPSSDEAFRLGMAEAALRLSNAKLAQNALSEVHARYSSDHGRRALLGAELALLQRDVGTAKRLLAAASPGPRKDLANARYLDLSEQREAARQDYEKAAKNPVLAAEATARMAAMELSVGRDERAKIVAAEAVKIDPTNLWAASVGTKALLASDEVDAAERVVKVGLKAHPNEPRILAAWADVQLAKEQWADARVTLDKVVAKWTKDASSWAKLGDALRFSGTREDSGRAYDKALAIDGQNVRALIGQLWLAVNGADHEKADAAEEALRKTRVNNRDADRARARYFVMKGYGARGIRPVRAYLARARQQDIDLWLTLGDLYLQAENPGGAQGVFDRALALDENNIAAQLGKVYCLYLRKEYPEMAPEMERLGELAKQGELSSEVHARLVGLESMLATIRRRMGPARSSAENALQMDPHSGEALYALARIAELTGKPAVEEFEKAVMSSRAPVTAAVARYVALATGEEQQDLRCELAKRYLRTAPAGENRGDMRGVAQDCRRR